MRLALVSCCLFVALTAASASAGDLPTIPLAWQGIWEVTTTVRSPCEIGTPMQSTSTDTLCVGDSFDPQNPEGPIPVCSGSATDTSYELTCTSTESIDDCTVTIVISFQGTRSGDTFSETGTVVTTADDPKVCGFTEFCTEINRTGTRTSSDPGVCALVPTEDASWGQVKATYR